MSSGKRRCSTCKYDLIPYKLPMRLTRDEWKRITRFFLMEQSSNSFVERTRFERCRVFRALTKIRIVHVKDVPQIFSGIVGVDETYLRDQWKNNRKSDRDQGYKRGRGTTKQPVFGIICRNGTVGEVVDDVGTANISTSHLKKSYSRFYYLFRYLKSIHRYHFAKIRPLSG